MQLYPYWILPSFPLHKVLELSEVPSHKHTSGAFLYFTALLSALELSYFILKFFLALFMFPVKNPEG